MGIPLRNESSKVPKIPMEKTLKNARASKIKNCSMGDLS
jgi:hypothetical protein